MAETAKPRARQRKKGTVTESTTIVVADKAVEHYRKDFEIIFEFDTDKPLSEVGVNDGYTIPGETVYSAAKKGVYIKVPCISSFDHLDHTVETLSSYVADKLAKSRGKVVDKKGV